MTFTYFDYYVRAVRPLVQTLHQPYTSEPVFSYKLRYIVGLALVEMTNEGLKGDLSPLIHVCYE